MKNYKGDRGYKAFVMLFIPVSLVILLIPISIMFLRSLERKGFANYTTVIGQIHVGKSLWNSFVVVGVTIAITVIVCSLAAYAFSKLRFRGKQALFIILMMGMMVPTSATLFPVFQITKTAGLMNKLSSLVGPYVTANAIFGLLMLKIFYDDLPNELMDAAKIDGASALQIFVKVYFPMSKPGLSVLLINTFCGSWNELMTCLTLIDNKEKYTMALLPYKFQLEKLAMYHNLDNWSEIFACLIICMIPIVVFYAFAQKLIFKDIASGAVKG